MIIVDANEQDNLKEYITARPIAVSSELSDAFAEYLPPCYAKTLRA